MIQRYAVIDACSAAVLVVELVLLHRLRAALRNEIPRRRWSRALSLCALVGAVGLGLLSRPAWHSFKMLELASRDYTETRRAARALMLDYQGVIPEIREAGSVKFEALPASLRDLGGVEVVITKRYVWVEREDGAMLVVSSPEVPPLTQPNEQCMAVAEGVCLYETLEQ